MILLALNKNILDIIKVILFFTNFEKKSNLFKIFKNNRLIQLVIKKTSILKQILENIIKKQEKSANHQKKKRKIALQLKEINEVYLLIENQKIRKKNKKLDNFKIGSFFI